MCHQHIPSTEGGFGNALMALISISSMNKFAAMGLIDKPIAAPSIYSKKPALKYEIGILQTELN